MKTLQILMSTYNGAKYIREQMDSLLEQDCEAKGTAAFCIIVRDDGSSDGTQDILEEYAGRYPKKISWYQGENHGVIRSFFELLQKAGASDYYAFCDQDDYWMPDKMSHAVETLQTMKKDGPVLYCCRPRLVDQNLQPLESEIKRPPMRPDFRNAMIENIVTGCTAVFDQTLRDMIVKELPEFTVMHDWWLYLTASCFGEIYYDETPYICYRQHQGNVLGTKTKKMDEWKMRLKRFRGNRGNISRQLGEFIRIFGDTDPGNEKLKMAEKFLEARRSFWARKHFLKETQVYRQRKEDDRIFHIILLLGNY